MLSGGPSDFPRSAAGVVALFSAGVYEGDAIQRGLTYLSRYIPRRRRSARTSHYFYGHYYAIQAMWHAGGEAWAAWYPAIRDELLVQAAAGWIVGRCDLFRICNGNGLHYLTDPEQQPADFSAVKSDHGCIT